MKRRTFLFLLGLCAGWFGMGTSAHADKLDDLGLRDSHERKAQAATEAPSGTSILFQRQSGGSMTVRRFSSPLPGTAAVNDRVEQIVRWLAEGPTDDEIAQGARGAFPAGSRLDGIEIDDKNIVFVRVEFPAGFLADPAKVASALDIMSESLNGSLLQLPVSGTAILARAIGATEFQPLDSFLPPPPDFPAPAPDTAVAPPSKAPASGAPEPLNAAQFPQVGSGRPVGALTGKAVYLNPGHGRTFDPVDDYYYWQRGFYQNNFEDHSNVDWVNQWLTAYCANAGADVFSVRETDFNTNMVIVDNNDPTGYTETGAWTDSSLTGYAAGHMPYVTGEDPFDMDATKHCRLAVCVVGAPTATARWTPNIPAAGWYNVYVDHAAYTNRTPQAHYRVYHAGGSTDYTLDQRMRRFTWICIGNYYFEAGSNSATGSVVLYNDSTSASHYVSADAVRFGGGMGLISRGTAGTSGLARTDEDARYNTQFCGAPTSVYDPYVNEDDTQGDESDGWTGRPRFGRWLNEGATDYGAPAQDAVFISHHTNGFDGTAKGMGTYVYTGYDDTWHDTFRNYVHDEVYNDLHNGYSTDFVVHGAGKHYGAYGEASPTNVSNQMPIFLGEWLFHDNATDMGMYHDPKFRMALARAVYQGVVKFWANQNSTPVNLLPEPPRNFRCKQLSTTSVQLAWDAPLYNTGDGILGDAATGYKVYISTHGRGFPAGTAVAGGATTTYTFNSLTPGTTYYFYATATNAGGESFPTEILAAKPQTTGDTPKLLIVNGFDKLDVSTRIAIPYSASQYYRHNYRKMNTFDYIVEHARAIDAYGSPIAFDSCNKICLDLNYVTLSDYAAVIWIGGLQAEVSTIDPTNDTSITTSEQTKLQTYLNAGGKLMVSGSEIAWDLDRTAGTSFVDTVLKANYQADSASVYNANGAAESIFNGITNIAFDDGSGPTYNVRWPDVLAASGESIAALTYSGTTIVDGFDALGSWKDPNYSGQTNADAASAFAIVPSPVKNASGSARLHYVWGTGNFIREYNSSPTAFDATSNYSLWIYGDNSGDSVRLCMRDTSDGELFVNAYLTINFTGWHEIAWNNIKANKGTRWSGSADNAITGTTVALDSIQISKTGTSASGDIYFDYATSTPGSGSGPVAAVQYSGAYRLVYMGFPFETILNSTQRATIMSKTLDFFFSTSSIEDWMLH